VLSGWEFPSLMRRHPSQSGRLRRRGSGFRSPLWGLWGRWRLLGEPRVGFQAGLLRPATKVAIAAFLVLDVILVYRLTANGPPARTTGGPGGGYTASSPTFMELREALRDLSTKLSDLPLIDGDAGRGTRHSTKRTGVDTPHETTPSSGSVVDSGTGGSATSSGTGGSATGSGSGGSDSGSSGGSTDEGGPGGGGLPGGGSGDGSGGGGGGGGGGG
jgi:hypothetical protein